jgi:hypothetical protein
MEKKFKIRDKRNKEWFWLDNEYFNGYGKIFGAVGVAIYVSLCRYANNKTQECFPSQEKIAENLNITSRTVRKYLKLFEEYKIIAVDREKDENTKRWKNNVYVLLDKSEWISPEEIISSGAIGNKKQKPEENKDTNHRKQFPNNNTNNNKTNNNNILHSNSDELQQNPSLKEDKKTKPKKDTNPEVLEVFKYFKEICAEEMDFEPVINYGKEGALIKRTLPLLEKNNVTWQELIDAYIYSKKADELGASLSIIFSSNNVNQFLTKKGRLSK